MRNVKQIMTAAMMVAAIGMTTKAMAGTISVNPNLSIVNTAGEVIEIIGTGTTFLTGPAAKVYFGPIAGGAANLGTGFTLIDDTHIIVKSPAKAKGCFDVTVTDGADVPLVALVDGMIYTQGNRTMQVSVNLTLGKSAAIAWGATTDNDDTITTPKFVGVGAVTHNSGTFAPYVWYVRDCEFGAPGTNAAINLGATYSTDGAGTVFPADNDNAHSLTITTTSKTSSNVRVDAITSDDVPGAGVGWTAAAAVGVIEKFKMEANLNGGITQTLSTAQTGAVTLLLAAAPTADMPLRLQVTTPTTSASVAGTLHTITVTLIAVAP